MCTCISETDKSGRCLDCGEQRDIKSPASPGCSTAPWLQPPLYKWAIVGMNHYHVDGERRLFVSMEKDGRCIKAEGDDDKYLWNRLRHQATGQ